MVVTHKNTSTIQMLRRLGNREVARRTITPSLITSYLNSVRIALLGRIIKAYKEILGGVQYCNI
jgi:hypothetical protein